MYVAAWLLFVAKNKKKKQNKKIKQKEKRTGYATLCWN